MKKIIRKIIYYTPEIFISLGAIVTYMAIGNCDFETLYRNGSTEGSNIALFWAWAFFAIGFLILRFRQAVQREQKRSRRK